LTIVAELVIIVTRAPMRKQDGPITEVLRQTIVNSGEAHIALERATGVQRASIMRFVRGTHSLRLDMADKLAAYFGLELRKAKRKSR
jgi:plasmid maintenance system antidote protein VapI